MTRELIVLLLQILAFTKAQEETVCKDGVQQVIEVPPTPPPFNCEDLEWPRDDKTFLITKADPEEVEFVYRERFTLTCKVCTRPGYNVTVTDLKWSKQEGELSPEVRVGVLDLTSRPAETSLIFSIPDEDDAGVYKCTPSATLTLELPPLVVPPESVPEEPEEEQNGQNNNSAVVPEVVPTVNATENTPTMPPVLIPQYETKVLETDRYIAYSVVKEADACAGDDPRFSIPLGNGNMLCFSVDGKGGDIFNLISDTHLSVNVKYIDGTDGYSVWMGELAFVLDNGCKVRVNADPESVRVDHMAVDKKFYDKDVQVDVYTGDYVAVKFKKLQVEFRVEFIDGHLSFYVVNDKGFSSRVHGLIGQFLNSKHEIVEAEDGHIFGLLKLQGRTRALLLQQKRWPYMHGHKEATCWGIQGKNPKGAIDWSHSSYKLMSLCQTKRRILTRPVFVKLDKTL